MARITHDLDPRGVRCGAFATKPTRRSLSGVLVYERTLRYTLPMSLLATNNLEKHFDGVYAVNKLSISFEAGKITSIVGPNGSGKSTLINTLTGMHEIDGGEVIIAGAEKLTRIRAYEVPFFGMTRTFQDVKLFEQMPVLDNILVVLTERSIWRALFEKHTALHLEKAEEVLKKVGLWDKRNELAKNLSYGQRKLLEIARVWAILKLSFLMSRSPDFSLK